MEGNSICRIWFNCK